MAEAQRKTFAVTYSYVPDIVERRAPHRPAHLVRINQLVDEDRILVAGAFTDPIDGALIVMEAESAGEVYAWVAEDPYCQQGLLTSVTVREVTVVKQRGR